MLNLIIVLIELRLAIQYVKSLFKSFTIIFILRVVKCIILFIYLHSLCWIVFEALWFLRLEVLIG